MPKRIWENCYLWGLQISLLCSWCIGAILTAIFYKVGKWKGKRIKQ